MSRLSKLASFALLPAFIFGLVSCGSGLPSNKSQSTELPSTSMSQFEVIHDFTSGTDAYSPSGPLLMIGSSLYGVTYSGGTNDKGTIFKVNSDGSGMTLLHSFATATGERPSMGVIADGSTLYGMTGSGGSDGSGVIYKIDTDGTNYTVIHDFIGATDGNQPNANLLLVGSTLYGTTYSSGVGNAGSVFKVNTDGTGFQVLHSFAQASTTNGTYSSQGTLVNIGSTLYGVTVYGGAHGNGTIYKVNMDGTGYTILHSFNQTDGNSGIGGLAVIGTTLYGVTESGGTNGDGVIYKINSDGTGFGLLHEFDGTDGSFTSTTMVASGSTLYGISTEGGANSVGTAFKINANGSGFNVLHHFESATGEDPTNVIYSAGKLYGTTYSGGANGNGVIFVIR